MSVGVKFKGYELLAKRWAKALFDLSLEDDGISKEDVLDDLLEVQENIEASSDLSSVLNNPSVSINEKQIVLEKLFKTKLMPFSFKFLTSLNEKNRISLLPAIAVEFRKELENIRNTVRVGITSAIELSDDKKEYIKNRIAEKLQRDIIPDWNIDFSIIGGLIFNINETIIDNSIKYKLDNLSKNIIKG